MASSDIPKLVEKILAGKDMWGPLLDAVEETGRPDEVWSSTVYSMLSDHAFNHPASGEDPAFNARTAMRQMFEGIAKVSYLYAVNLHLAFSAEERTGDPYRSRDSGMQTAAVDGMNRAKCGVNWSRDLQRESMEWLTSELGNFEKDPLVYRSAAMFTEPRGECITVDGIHWFTLDGPEHRYADWLDHAPEWMEKELQKEHGWDREFLTVYNGGGFTADPDYMIIGVVQDEEEIWQLVSSGVRNPEVECPFKSWDPVEREDRKDPKVTMEDTFCGDSPGRRCRFCDTDLGEEHGVIYEGEGSESVYMRLDEDHPMRR